jgi:hypothetical protein
MKKSYIWLALLALIIVSVSGCAVRFGWQQPVVVVPPMAPATVFVPDFYVWDGAEYVGWCSASSQYMYWIPTGWIICDPKVRLRFDIWTSRYPEWRREVRPYRGEHLGRYRR